LGLRLDRNEASTSSRTPVAPTTSTISKTVETSAETRTNPSSVSVPQAPSQDPDWELLARSIVDIWSPGCEWGGSGTIVLDGSYILTNAHVAENPDGSGTMCDLNVGFTDRFTDPPDNYLPAEVVLLDADIDLAVLRLNDRVSGKPTTAWGRAPIDIQHQSLKLGEPISALGYPGVGGLSITYSEGSVSGTITIPADNKGGTGEFIKTTDLNLNHGNSGGAAFNSTGQFVGIPTAGFGAEVVCEDEACIVEGSSVGLIRPSSFARALLDQIP
jgi:S1-C subfamily serine protease